MIRYLDEYRDPRLIEAIADRIRAIAPTHPINLMEVCGGHTLTIFKYGLKHFLPSSINLISGPGCPVCVTDNSYIDYAVALSARPELIIASFGDMLRVPGSTGSLQSAKADGADVRICYSPLEALVIAEMHPERQVVFLGIGFETTAPLVASAILRAAERDLTNFSVLSAHKVMPPAMQAIIQAGEIALHGFICPGHVTAITGPEIYEFIARDYHLPCVVTGFEPLDLLEAILRLVEQIRAGIAKVENQYRRAVKPGGNAQAQAIMREVFEPAPATWRGLGTIPQSGLRIRDKYRDFCAETKFPLTLEPAVDQPGCICGDVMRGLKTPPECPLFRTICQPEHPCGACMVSAEGTCATYFKYHQSIP